MIKSDDFPRFLGLLLILAGGGYLMDSIANFLLPNYTEITSWFVIISAVIAEFLLCFWLLFKGIKLKKIFRFSNGLVNNTLKILSFFLDTDTVINLYNSYTHK